MCWHAGDKTVLEKHLLWALCPWSAVGTSRSPAQASPAPWAGVWKGRASQREACALQLEGERESGGHEREKRRGIVRGREERGRRKRKMEEMLMCKSAGHWKRCIQC